MRKLGTDFLAGSAGIGQGIMVKLKGNRFRLDIRKNSFTMGMIKHKNRLPREVMDAISMGTLKVKITMLTFFRTP